MLHDHISSRILNEEGAINGTTTNVDSVLIYELLNGFETSLRYS